MRALVIGAGGVGSAIANIASRKSFITELVIADYDASKAHAVTQKIQDPRFTSVEVDAGDLAALEGLIRKVGPDVVINAVDPRFVMNIFNAAKNAGVNYMDMALSLSIAHPTDPFNKVGVKLGDDQFAQHDQWLSQGNFALIGIGIEPGMSDIFARYAQDYLFSEIDAVTILDGSSLTVDGYEFAPSFSIWTTIEECLNPPLIWNEGWHTTKPFTGGVTFDFPEGIGPVECVDVEHEEVALIPQKINARKVTFKYGLGNDFIEKLKTIHALGLSNKHKVKYRGMEIAPRDFLASLLPDPATIGPVMHGKTCAGAHVAGLNKEGKPYACYIYNVVDNEWSMKNYGDQAVVWQTAINPVMAMELIANGTWKPAGVVGPEWLEPKPFLDLIESYGSSWHIRDEDPAGIGV
ncbi:MAG: saccharopine dehydrogenase NADP-binding domain-containing protein [Candidatus Planktophila sp.]|nr:saccharopine dehydrogenase NADP-binding domain-containing protein [Candidatus Planktophila sp.]